MTVRLVSVLVMTAALFLMLSACAQATVTPNDIWGSGDPELVDPDALAEVIGTNWARKAAEFVKGEYVLAPWGPVSVEGRTIGVWGRDYTFGNGLFPCQILSQGEALLASPVRLELAVGGKPLTFQPSTFKVVEQRPGRVFFCISAEAPIDGIRKVAVKVDAVLEFDGMIWFDVRVTPGGDTGSPLMVDLLELVIPLNPCHATLYQHWPLVPVWNWHGDLSGILNAGRVEKAWSGPFVPFFWVGDEKVGLQWFAETNVGWEREIQAIDRVINLIPRDWVTELRITVIGRPKEIGRDGFLFGFGLQASPVKPFIRGDLGYAHGIDYVSSRDPEFLKRLKDAGARFVAFHEGWTEYQGFPRTDLYVGRLKTLVERLHSAGLGLMLYLSAQISDRSPEFAEYGDEWVVPPRPGDFVYQRSNPPQTDYGVAQDAAGWARFMIAGVGRLYRDIGIDGLYYDGLILPSRSIQAKTAVPLGREKYAIRASRYVAKWLYGMTKCLGKPTLIVTHQSGYITLPTLAFTDAILDGEHIANQPKGSFKMPFDFFRAGFMGYNFGIPMYYLVYEGPNKAYTVEDALAFTLVHGVDMPWSRLHPRVSRIRELYHKLGVDKGAWIPYWDPRVNGKAVLHSVTEGVVTSGYLTGDGLLLVIASELDSQVTADVIADIGTLRGPSVTVNITDYTELVSESMKGVISSAQIDGELRLSVPVGARECRLLWIGFGE